MFLNQPSPWSVRRKAYFVTGEFVDHGVFDVICVFEGEFFEAFGFLPFLDEPHAGADEFAASLVAEVGGGEGHEGVEAGFEFFEVLEGAADDEAAEGVADEADFGD